MRYDVSSDKNVTSLYSRYKRNKNIRRNKCVCSPCHYRYKQTLYSVCCRF